MNPTIVDEVCPISGVNTAQQLAAHFAGRFRIVLVEKNSHFQHLFAYPRFAVATGVDTHKAFIPYTPGTFANCPKDSGVVVQARVLQLTRSVVHLDRSVSLDGISVRSVPYSYLVSCVRSTERLPSLTFHRSSRPEPNSHRHPLFLDPKSLKALPSFRSMRKQ